MTGRGALLVGAAVVALTAGLCGSAQAQEMPWGSGGDDLALPMDGANPFGDGGAMALGAPQESTADRPFLEEMEDWQRQISILQQRVRFKELEARLAESDAKIREIEIEQQERMREIQTQDQTVMTPEEFNRQVQQALPAGAIAATGMGLPAASAAAAAGEAPANIYVSSIRGVGDDLTATLITPGGGVVKLHQGDEFPEVGEVLKIEPGYIKVQPEKGKPVTYVLSRGIEESGAGGNSAYTGGYE